MRTSIRTLALSIVAPFVAVAPVAAQSWTSAHPVQPSWSTFYAAAVAEQGGENQIFLFGGTDGLSSEKEVLRYHRTFGWFVMNDMPAGRYRSAADTVEVSGQDYVHLFGGGIGSTGATTTNWRYDPSTDSWDSTTYAPMPVAKANMEAVTAPNGLIYVFGGNDAAGGTTYSSLDIFNPIANTWTAGPAMPRARRNFAAVKDCDGFIYLYGGTSSSTPIGEVDCFDTVANVWVVSNPHTGGALPDMPTPRTDIAGALGRNGRHYITGGNIASPVAVPLVEAFHPYSNTWSTEPSMLQSRNAHRVVGLGSRIWVMAGYRKIWPTTNKLESFGSLGAFGPCGDDVAPLPPPTFGSGFATAVGVQFTDSVIGGVVHPGGSNFFTCQAIAGVKTFFDLDIETQPNGLLLRSYDEQRNLISEGPARDGMLLDPSGLQTSRFYVEVAEVQGIGSSAYDLYVTSSNDPQPIGAVYCTPAVPNSTGDPSGIAANGLVSGAANSVRLQVASLPPQSFGYFLVSPLAGTIVNPGGSVGVLCLTGFQIGRYAGNVLNSGPNGEVSLAIDLTSIPGNPPVAVQPGDRWYFTYWHRDADPVHGITSNFSDGVCLEFK